MTSESLKIITVEQGMDVSKLIRSIYGSLHFLMETVTPDQNIQDLLTIRSANLLVIDNDIAGFSAKQIKLWRQTNAHLFIILISQDDTIIQDISGCEMIRLISSKDLATKFPLILSEAYSAFTESIYSGLAYGKLLKHSLNNLSGIVLIVNQQGNIVFLNQEAEQLLGLDDNIHQDENLVAALVDGPKIWKYILDSCGTDQENQKTFLLKFINKRQDILTRQIRIKPVESENKYFLLQEFHSSNDDHSSLHEPEEDILETFSESVANELLNPANVLSGRLQLMQAEIPGQNPLRKHVDSISQQIQRIDEIIAKLLTFARLKQDFVPQKVNVNDVLESIQLDPSVIRLNQRAEVKTHLELEREIPILSAQMAHLDLLFKMVLEICFNCLESSGTLEIQTSTAEDALRVNFTLIYSADLFDDALTIQGYLGTDPDQKKQKSIETTIIRQILQQYDATHKVSRLERNTEKLEISFPVSQSLS